MDVTIAPADPGEAPALAALHLGVALTAYRHIFPIEASAPTLDEVEAQWAEWLGPDGGGRRAFTARTAGGTIIGVVVASPDPIEPDAGHLSRLYVDTTHWGRGIGTKLYATAIDQLTSSDFSDATLWVLEHNARARAWYERLGWQLTGERKSVYPPVGIDDVRYRITL